VVPMASQEIGGVQGWRVAFVVVGSASIGVSAFVAAVMEEPLRCKIEGVGETGCGAVAHEAHSLLQFFRIPSFCVLLIQGIFGTIPWSVMGFATLFFQLTGISDHQAAILSGAHTLAGAAGNILGGLVADALAFRYLLHGRPLSAQITVACGIPVIYMMFWGVPPGEGTFGMYFGLSIAFGLLGSWAQSGTNFPVLAHIVPAQARTRVMAWECALENSVANAIGPLVVSLLAERSFGYSFGDQLEATFPEQGAARSRDIPSARALGKALATTICIPWALCFVAYSFLHWSYPRDARLVEGCATAAQVGRSPAVRTPPEETPGARRSPRRGRRGRLAPVREAAAPPPDAAA